MYEAEVGSVSLVLERDFVPVTESYAPPSQPQLRLKLVGQQTDRHVVIPDIHGEHAVLSKIVDQYYDDSDIGFVFLGDLIDRKGVTNDPEKGVYKTLDIVKNLGERAVVTTANHEWMLRASMFASDPSERARITRDWLGTPPYTMEQNVLSSYGVTTPYRDHGATDRLEWSMMRVGHLGVILDTVPYYETDSFIATHAGIQPDVSWEVQRTYLDEVTKEMGDGLYYDRPPQWFSMELATNTMPILHTDKVVVSGHAHVLHDQQRRRYKNQSSDRSIHGGKRIRLASTLNAPTKAPAYVWQDWNEEIVEFPQG